YQCVITAFSDGTDITLNGMVYALPRKWSLASFKYMIDSSSFLTAALNSVLRTLSGCVISVFVTSGYAYALSHSELKLRKLYTALGLITMYFGGGLIPTFLVIRDLGLYNNFLVHILPTAFSMFNAMVFLANFRGVPRALEESATIDGANELVYYFRILLPVSLPVFACVLLFDAVAQWNAYYDCMIYTQDENLVVLAHLFARMLLSAQYIEQRVADAATAGASAEELMALGSGFGSGMGGMEGTCGAFCGAVMALGMLNQSERPSKMIAKDMMREFKAMSGGATICGDLKGIKSGKMLCSCDDCVRHGVLALENSTSWAKYSA
ncbi:MAG: C-GCAxxG-C-C family protein, partial [Selenomonadaceae bacterium]|nr:C-GCAxxG-C-C family protein [Selenomonadaceae bacterium]